MEKPLDWCSEYGLAYLVNFPGAGNTNTSTAKSMLMRVKYHDAFAGIMQMDEPGRVDFDSIANSADTINDVLPEDIIDQVLLHVNIFPNYATDYQLYNRVNSGELPEGGYSYNQYVEDYMNIIKPKVLSYDNYPLTGHEDGLNGTSYFSNMSVIREAAMEANIPFWVFVETCSFNAGNRVPDQAEILWQVNTALSFGAKGLQYFTGVIPVSSAEEFSGAMFDLYGNKTAVYDYVKTANEQVQAVDHVLMHSISKGMMQVGSLPYSGESGFRDEDIIPSYKKLTSAQGAHSLIGCFDYDGLTAYYITNNSITEDESLTLNFSESVKGYYIAKGEQTSFNAATLTLQMQPGEGILVVVK